MEGVQARRNRDSRPSRILFVLVDCLRLDALHPETTPNFWRLKNEGIFLANAIAEGNWTKLSVMSAMTGLHPWNCSVGYRLKQDVPTLASQLKDEGYQTVGFTSNPLASSELGLDRGFQHFDETLSPIPSTCGTLERLLHKYYAIGLSGHYLDGRFVVGKASSFLSNVNKPFFAFVHFMDAHAPYFPRRQYAKRLGLSHLSRRAARDLWRKACLWEGKKDPPPGTPSQKEIQTIRKLYLAEVLEVDAHVGVILQKIKPDLLILWSDHGDLFWEHEPRFGHGTTFYEEVIRVPVIVWGKGVLQQRIDSQVQLKDLFPTILDLAGAPSTCSTDGTVVFDETKRDAITAQSLTSGEIAASLRSPPWKYVHDETRDFYALFNLEKGEETNFIEEEEDVHEELRISLLETVKPVQYKELEYSEKLMRRLKNLGYIT